jgi:phosphoribosylformylglycinamidine synthase
LGVCNGFQILTESGLLEGALLHNNNQQFICKNVHLKAVSQDAPITKGLDNSRTFKIPIAHGEGRFYADQTTLERIQANDQVLFTYCNAEGQVDEQSNPNGAVLNIAGITNAGKNVFGMMPHPERAADRYVANEDGKLIFESLLRYC